MNHLIRISSLLTLMTILVVSCVREPNTPDNPKQKDELKLVSASEATIGAEGGDVEIRFTASDDWTVEPSNDRAQWIGISPSSGSKGSATVKVSVNTNDTPDERSATLRIKCGTASASVTITQKQKDALIMTPSKTQFDAGGGSFTIEVKANIEYSFKLDADWIHQSSTKALNTKTTTFIVDKNEDTRKREGSVTVVSALGSEKVTIYQEAADASIVLSSESVAVATGGGNFTVDVNTNVDVTMAIAAGAEWLSEVKTKSMSTHSYTFKALPNETTDSREGRITFKSAETGIEAAVRVTQMQKGAIVIAQPLYEIGAAGGRISVEATTNLELDVQISETWVRQITTKSMSTVAYEFEVEPNNGYDCRECRISFSGGEDIGQSLSQTVTVRQDGVDGFIPDFQDKYTVSPKAQVLELRSRSSVEVVAKSKCDWITVVETKALKDSNISLQIAENTSDSSRSGEVEIDAPALGQSRTVTITQKGAGEMFIPDPAFYAWLLSQFDTDGNGVLSESECAKVEYIELPLDGNLNIKSLQGLEYFPNLYGLKLAWVPEDGTPEITELVISGNPKLRNLELDNLSTLETLSLDCPLLDYLSVKRCLALSGVDLSRFKELSGLMLNNCPWLNVLDCTSNTNLHFLRVESCPALNKIIAPCRKLGSLNIYYCTALNYSDIVLPHEDFSLKYLYIDTIASFPEEIDLSMCPVLTNVLFSSRLDYWKISTIWLRTGVSLKEVAGFAKDAEIRYKGDDVSIPVQFQSDAFRQLILSRSNYDINEDGELSAFELGEIDNFYTFSDWYTPDEAISTLEDIGLMKNLKSFALYGFGDKVSAPLPESLKTLAKLESFNLENCRIQGTLPEWIADMPSLTEFSLQGSYPVGGEIPQKFLMSDKLTYLNLRDCSFTGSTIVVPAASLMDYDSKYYNCNNNKMYFLFAPQHELVTRVLQDGSDEFLDMPKILYKSDVDGTGDVHPDGEAVLYHAATKGPGIDFVITGDGFSAENNTVGGTLETYMTACAEQFLHQNPYDKLAEYYNVWFVYAHSTTEGSGISGDFTKFGTKHHNPGRTSTVSGNHYLIKEYVGSAIGKDCSEAVIAVIMNSSVYGGTCYWSLNSNLGWNYSIAYTPASPGIFLPTFIHETLGHGIGKLADEYNADSSNPGSAPSTAPYWEKHGMRANVDDVSDPSAIRWHKFLSDPRYANEGLGVFEGANYANYGWYRPSYNSVMNIQWNEGGDSFNAPSREAIYQWTMFKAGGEALRSAYSDWASYISGNYNYEEFVAFDKSSSPSGTSAKKMRLAPKKAIIHDGRVVEQKLPPHTPPVLIIEN